MSVIEYAPRENVLEAVKAMPIGYIYCRRRNRHAWDPNQSHVNSHRGYYDEISPCLHCGSELHEVISKRTGEIVKSFTVYAAGYLLEGVGGRVSKEDRGLFRLEAIKRKTRRRAA